MTGTIAPPVRTTNWPPTIRVLGQIGGGAVASGLLSAGAAKIVASALGPAGVAVLGTLQQCRETGAAMATLSGQTALIQGASGLTGLGRREFLRTSMCLFGSATLAVVLGMLVASETIAGLVGLGVQRAPLIRWLTVSVALASAYVFLNGVVSAIGAVKSLAGLQLAAPAAMLLFAYPTVRGAAQHQERWLLILLATPAFVAVVAALLTLAHHRHELGGWIFGSGCWWSCSAARRFFVTSGCMLVTGLVSNCALAAVRAAIAHNEGLTVTGQFDAAWSIGVNLSAFLLASAQAYHLPVLAKASGTERTAHLRSALCATLPAAAVLIVGLAALKPLALRLLYTTAFGPAVLYLRWTLPGIYLKATSWIFAVSMLACADTRVFLTGELAAWITFWVGTAALSHWRGLAESASIAFVLMNAVHLIISGLYARRRQGFRWDTDLAFIWLANAAMILTVSAATWTPVRERPAAWLGQGVLWIVGALLAQAAFLRRPRGRCAA